MTRELRTRLDQRLPAGDNHIAIGGLRRVGGGEPATLARLRPTLMTLAHGGPFTYWFDGASAEHALHVEDPRQSPSHLCYQLCEAIREGSLHLEQVEDDFERFFARIAINVQEKLGVALPQLSENHAIWCRHFATSVSRAYSEITAELPGFPDSAVLFVMGVPDCDGVPDGLHAWNWLVDFSEGTVRAFDPQVWYIGEDYPNVSSLL